MRRSHDNEANSENREHRPLRIAIASGKGGTGKTTVAANLAATLIEEQLPVAYIDCDVEAPNGHLFFNTITEKSTPVYIPVPEIDDSRCTLCGACGAACRFSAVVALPNTVLTFPKLCHGCGGCVRACSVGAIRTTPREVGVVEEKRAGIMPLYQGTLQIGESMAPPVIRDLLKQAPSERILILDAPPGTSCPVVEVVKFADGVVLVTEPTPFGLNDLKLAVEMVRTLKKPFSVVVNRAGIGNDDVLQYCEVEGIPVLLQIANERAIAEAYSRGRLAVDAVPSLKPQFSKLYESLSGQFGPPPTQPETEEETLAIYSEALLSESKRPAPFRETPSLSELVVVSGKGGTGKTGIAASFLALLAPQRTAAAADCDVDAADLHLILSPQIQRRNYYSGGKKAVIDQSRCSGCGACMMECRFDAVRETKSDRQRLYKIQSTSCEGCGVCVDSCPESAVALVPVINGEWFVSKSRFGPFAHARLGTASENSGKLVSLVRRKGREAGGDDARTLLICDGSPGIGCPVISSLTGATMVLIVSEPTLSGMHDMKRIAKLCDMLGATAGVCVNKADLNLEVAEEIEREAARLGIPNLGRIRYDESVIAAQVRGISVVEYNEGPAAADICSLWKNVQAAFNTADIKTRS